MIQISKHKRYYTNSRGKRTKVKPKKRSTKKRATKKVKPTTSKPEPQDNVLAMLQERVSTCVAKVNELVTNTNEAIGKICDVLDEHDKRIKHIIGSQSTMQDSIKTVVNEVNKLLPKNKKG